MLMMGLMIKLLALLGIVVAAVTAQCELLLFFRVYLACSMSMGKPLHFFC